MKLLNLFMGLFKKKKVVPDGLAAKDEIKTDAAIIGDSILINCLNLQIWNW